MSIPNRVLVVDKRLLPVGSGQLQFIQLTHPRTKQEQSFALDQSSRTIFELVQCSRPHSSWFINDQYVVPDGSLYLVTPIHLIFLLLPPLWSNARTSLVPLPTIVKNSIKDISLDDRWILEKLEGICDVDHQHCSVQLKEEKLFVWLRDRVDRLQKQLIDEEHAFDLVCQYLPDEIIERCQQEWQLHGNVRYDLPVGQKALVTTTTTTSVVSVTTKSKRSKK